MKSKKEESDMDFAAAAAAAAAAASSNPANFQIEHDMVAAVAAHAHAAAGNWTNHLGGGPAGGGAGEAPNHPDMDENVVVSGMDDFGSCATPAGWSWTMPADSIPPTGIKWLF